jgi:small multidrug resistance pump
MKAFLPYFFLLLAVFFGTASNSFAKSAEGFSLVLPSLLSAITIILCMYGLSNVMKTVPIGVTYASFAGLCILATSLVGVFKFAQIPNLYTSIGLILIIAGVIIVNVFGVKN